ncbi:hypothetical protein JT05_04285 [Desulfosporosinus sp. Tol-M]|nr:hypothetical protein JT05_04285 [Desulfosporosinus sp. Tol-M]
MWSFVCCAGDHNIIAKITSTVKEEEKLKGDPHQHRILNSALKLYSKIMIFCTTSNLVTEEQHGRNCKH